MFFLKNSLKIKMLCFYHKLLFEVTNGLTMRSTGNWWKFFLRWLDINDTNSIKYTFLEVPSIACDDGLKSIYSLMHSNFFVGYSKFWHFWYFIFVGRETIWYAMSDIWRKYFELFCETFSTMQFVMCTKHNNNSLLVGEYVMFRRTHWPMLTLAVCSEDNFENKQIWDWHYW